MRIDKYLVEVKKIESRAKAQQLIEGGCVKVNDITVYHKNYDVKDGWRVEVNSTVNYVSRGAQKLIGAIASFNLDFNKKVILDVGSSTGGFTQVALLNNAKHIYSVDVGTNQLHESLRDNPRITLYENTHLKDINLKMFKQHIDFLIADLSFISVKNLLDKITDLFKYKLQVVILIKPQFELSKDIVCKYDGVIKLPPLHKKAVEGVLDHARRHHFKVLGVCQSPIAGKDGNIEFFAHLEWK